MSWVVDIVQLAGVELAAAAVLAAIIGLGVLTLHDAQRAWCDHEPHTRYVGHVVVELADGDGIAPAYVCVRCCREWVGAVEPLRRPLADVVRHRNGGRVA